eukprot:13136949-Alexandrium_andersonii.AAC.1
MYSITHTEYRSNRVANRSESKRSCQLYELQDLLSIQPASGVRSLKCAAQERPYSLPLKLPTGEFCANSRRRR